MTVTGPTTYAVLPAGANISVDPELRVNAAASAEGGDCHWESYI